MPAVTFAQMPGTQTSVEIPEGHEGPFTLGHLFARMGIDPELRSAKKNVSVNGRVTTDMETPLTEGSVVILTENVAGA